MVQAAAESKRSGPELAGRREELAALEDELGRAEAGEFRVVLLLGEAGVGKSRLAREVLSRHGEVTGLVAQAYPLAASAAFGLWTEAVDPFLRSLSDAEVVELCGGLLDDLASLFHRVALVRGSVPERDPPLPRLLQGVAGLLGALSQRRPLVVLLDDVHFADASSWQALRYFARHLDDARLLVLATSRPAELAGHDVAAQVLFELDQDALLSRLEVAPLARPGMRELAEAVIERPAPRALVEWLAERSQGNPLFAIGLLRALMEERGDLSAPHLRRLPEGLTERVASELRRFDAAPREMLERLAVLGRPVSLGDLTTLTSSSLEEVGPMLAELVRAGIVVEEERGSELDYELYHPLVRDVIYQATSGATRRVLHRQSARSLLRAGHLAEAALHFARSAERGDSEAVDVLLDAMRQAERREAFREALDLQAELVELLPADDQRWLEVLEAMYARPEWLIDHRAETNAPVAIAALRAIDGLLEGSSDHARRAIVNFRLANFLAWGTGELDPAQDACRQARDLFSRAGDRRQALLARRELAWIKGLQGDLAGMGADARAVVEAADAIGDRFIAMQGLAAVGYSANFRGAFAEAEAAQRRAAAIARQDAKAYRLTTVLGGLALGLALQGRVAETAAPLEEAKAANPAYRDSILVELEAAVNWIAGDFNAALALAREGAAWQAGGDGPAASHRDGPGGARGHRGRRRRRSGASVRAGARGLRRAGLVLLPAGDAVGGRGARVARRSRGGVRRGPAARGGAAGRHGRPACGPRSRCSTWPRPRWMPGTSGQPGPPRSSWAPWRRSRSCPSTGAWRRWPRRGPASTTTAPASERSIPRARRSRCCRRRVARVSWREPITCSDGRCPPTSGRRRWPRSRRRRRCSSGAEAAGAGNGRSTRCGAWAALAGARRPRHSGPTRSPAASGRSPAWPRRA